MIDDKVYKFFSKYIYDHSGMMYAEKDYYRLDSRLKKLMEYFEKESIDAVYEMYQGHINHDMHAVLINFSTNNETYFFRDVKPFKALVEEIVPNLMEENPASIKIWSAACSSGQEPYSILMAINEKVGEKVFSKVSIDASDISTEILEKARKGIYSEMEAQRGLPIARLVQNFQQLDENTWQINQNYRTKCNFFSFNLLKDIYRANYYDVIFCRNVLIYQTQEDKNTVLNNMFKALRPGGVLIMGSGESLIGLKTEFEKVSFKSGLTGYSKPK